MLLSEIVAGLSPEGYHIKSAQAFVHMSRASNPCACRTNAATLT